MVPFPHVFKLLIGGELCDSPERLSVIDPSTGEIFTDCPKTTPALLDSAVAAARNAFPVWSHRSHDDRLAVLARMADAIQARSEEIAQTLTHEQGKPLAQSRIEIDRVTVVCRSLGRLVPEVEVIQDDAMSRVEVHRLPIGVVAAIVPWNVPVMQAFYKIAPAILMGNTVVLKTAPTTPLATLLIGEIIRNIVPPGVVNILTDAGDIGPLLVAHRDVALVSFTGSIATGKRVMAAAAESLKRVTLELGGNDAAVVLDDVDVKAVAAKLFRFAFFNCGQVCVSIKRIYAHTKIYDALCNELATLARAARVGPGSDPDVEIGPLQNKRQYDATLRYLELAHTHGRVIAGGKAMADKGYFVQPTIVRDITEGNALIDEETFGPVRSVLRFDDVENVIARVNATRYGLGGSVWSKDIERARAIASRIESGTVWINQHIVAGAHVPMAGIKQSGIGVENGKEGLAELTRIHVISIAKG